MRPTLFFPAFLGILCATTALAVETAKPAPQKKAATAAKADPRKQHVDAVVPEGVAAHYDLVFAKYGEASMLLDLFQPQAATAQNRLPAVLVITGGGWINGDRKRLGHIATWLSGQGYVTAALDYQLATAATPSFPRNIQDCKAAVRFLRANADRFGIDAERIGVVGGSAGGHLAALLGTSVGVAELEGAGGNAASKSGVQAVAVMAGPVNLDTPEVVTSRPANAKPTSSQVMLGKSYAEAPELYRLASPLHHLKAGAPPFLFLDGSLDQPEKRYVEFRARLRELGSAERMVVLSEGPHGMWNMAGWFPEVAKTLQEFLDANLKKAR
jgi:pectinesterase